MRRSGGVRAMTRQLSCASLRACRRTDINLNVGINTETFVANFRQAAALLGNELPPLRRRMKVIDADDTVITDA